MFRIETYHMYGGWVCLQIMRVRLELERGAALNPMLLEHIYCMYPNSVVILTALFLTNSVYPPACSLDI